MKVKNINGTSESSAKCKCGSWIKHWEKFAKQSSPVYCVVTGCMNKNPIGAHVQKHDSIDQNWYIIPACDSCNQKKNQVLSIPDATILVKANKKETCG